MYASLWGDFFRILEKLKRFEADKAHVDLGESDIEEFIELKKVLENMTRRLSRDYGELRDYTSHTTHELQTPLAVIKSKTELLLQSDRVGEEEIKLIKAIYTSADHLSRLNSALALITRIENQQFTEKKPIKLSELANHHLEMLGEIIELRKLKVSRSYQDPDLAVTMDPGLADILMTNLLKNAVVHNTDGGSIEIDIHAGEFSIRNSGEPLAVDPADLFSRFTRDASKSGNFGLGLSLVQKICDFYGLTISYRNEDKMHIFTLKIT
jgi:signal transduction histidine kinase